MYVWKVVDEVQLAWTVDNIFQFQLNQKVLWNFFHDNFVLVRDNFVPVRDS